MSLLLINEIWKLLHPSIEAGDTYGAAENLVNYLIEEDFSPSEISHMFRNDKDMKKAVSFFMETPDDGLYHKTEVFPEDDDDEYYSFNDDDDDYNY
jgi:hypothetical protein